MYLEMNRVGNGVVALHDFSPGLGGFSALSIPGILEKLEGSDYIEFRRNGVAELEEIFDTVRVIPLDRRTSWYLCRG
jgi:hypothetical protein